VLLKFAALRESGLVADGFRGAGDVDVLAPPDHAPALAGALSGLGLRPAGFPAEAHQLPLLRDAKGRAVEVHVQVPGLRVAADPGSATVAALDRAGLLRRLDLPGGCSAPVPHALAAHAVVHALGQHGLAPESYPLLRLVVDLVALGAHADERALARRALPLVEGAVTAAEMDAAVALAARLAGGDRTVFDDAGAAEAVLLRHVVAGVLDPDYRASLRLRGLSGGGGPAGFLNAARHALVLTDAQIDVVYGPPRSRLGYVGRRLARPFDLMWRLVRYAAAGRRLRRRRTGNRG
jgi:hypothetical protein